MDLNTYWETTPKKFEKFVNVYIKKEEERAREMDLNNFNLGKYMAFAVNDPKKYPKKPFLWEEKEESRIMTGEEMDKMMRRNNLILGGTVKWQTQ